MLRTLVFGSLLSAAEGRAQLPELAIGWDGPRSCSRPASLEDDVARRIGPERPDRASVRVRVRELGAAGFELTVSLLARAPVADSSRTVELASCDDVQRAAAILIATALAPTDAAVKEPPRNLVEPALATRAWSLRVTGIGDYQLLPEPRAGIGFGVQHTAARAQLWVEARYLFRATAEWEGAMAEALAVEVELLAGALGTAFTWRRGGFRFGPQAEVEAGSFLARGRLDGQLGPLRSALALSLWLGFLMDYELAARVAFHAGALGGFLVAPPNFEADGVLGHQVRAVDARIVVGLRILLGAKKSGASGQ